MMPGGSIPSTGTWVRIKRAFCSYQHSLMVDLYTEHSSRLYKVDCHQFFIRPSGNSKFNEVRAWLQSVNFPKEFEAIRDVIQMSDLPSSLQLRRIGEYINQQFLLGAGIDRDRAARFIRKMGSVLEHISSEQEQTKACELELVFTEGPLQGKTLILDGTKPILFGSGMPQKQSTEQKRHYFFDSVNKISEKTNFKYFQLPEVQTDQGQAKIEPCHFWIFFDFETGTYLMENLSSHSSNGLYKRLFPGEQYSLMPDDAFRIGTLAFEVERFNTGVYASIGCRDAMEDAYSSVQDLLLHPDIQASYFAVFDGHGGNQCALFLKQNLHIQLVKAFVSSEQAEGTNIMNSEKFETTFVAAVRQAYQTTDQMYKEAYPDQAKQCGATAIVCLVIGQKLFCINLGDFYIQIQDARAILSRNSKAIDLSFDHKASRKDEQERIKKEGGYIVFGRVLGRLAVTRAFGDFDCKQIEVGSSSGESLQSSQGDIAALSSSGEMGQKPPSKSEMKSFVLSEPEIRVTTIDPEQDEFILLASDGLFDRFTSQECVNLARDKLCTMPVMEQDVNAVARSVVLESTNARVNSDNTTVIIVSLNAGVVSYEEMLVPSQQQQADPFSGFDNEF